MMKSGKFIQKFFSNLLSRTENYLENCSVHGLRYLTQKERHLIERLFWVFMCIIAWWGTIHLILKIWSSYEHDAVSFTVDTSYLDWKTRFPAVTICEERNHSKAWDFAKKNYPNTASEISQYVRDIAFYDGECSSCAGSCMKDNVKCPSDIENIIKQIRANCTSLIDKCKWFERHFNCCDYFVQVLTPWGPCYSTNSIIARGISRNIDFLSDQLSGPGVFTFTPLLNFKVFIHSPEDLPYYGTPSIQTLTVKKYNSYEYVFQIKEIMNDPKLPDVPIKIRGCRYPYENYLTVSHHYSTTACIIQCQLKYQLEACNCTQPFTPKSFGSKYCDLKGLICLRDHSETLSKMKADESIAADGLVCKCLPSCTESEYINVLTLSFPERDNPVMRLKMLSLPTERFKRNVVRSKLDVVVSAGGTAGLFLGASLLSAVEFIMYFCIRAPKNGYLNQKLNSRLVNKKIDIMKTLM